MEIGSVEVNKVRIQMYPPQPPPKNLRQYIQERQKEETTVESSAESNAESPTVTKHRFENLATIECPDCKTTGVPVIEKKIGMTAWTIFFILCCFCYPFCFIPLCFESCKDTHYYCKNCGKLLSIKPP